MRKGISRIIAISVLMLSTLLLFTACSSNANDVPQLGSPAVSTPNIGQSGVLRVGVNTANAPLAGKSGNKIIGLDVDIAAAIADELGLKLEIVDVGANPTGALEDKKVDIVMGIDQSDSNQGFWRSSSYMGTGIAAFATSSTDPVPTNGSGESFGAQVSSKSAWAVEAEFGKDSLTTTTTLNDAFADLEAGTVDYVAADAIIGYYAAHSQNIQADIVALLMRPSGYCIGVSATNTALQQIIDETVDTLVDNGVIGVIQCKWLGTEIITADIPLTNGADAATTQNQSSTGAGEANGVDTDGDGLPDTNPNATSTDANGNATGTDAANGATGTTGTSGTTTGTSTSTSTTTGGTSSN